MAMIKHLALMTCLLIAVLQTTSCTRMPVPAAQAGSQTAAVRVMSFNIQHDREWESRNRLIVRAVREQSPDLIGLQEALVWQVEFLASELPQFDFVAAGRDDGQRGGESVGILYRKDRFQLQDSGSFWFSDTPDTPGSMPGGDWGTPNFPRICTWVLLHDRSSGKSLFQFNVHLQHDAGSDPGLARLRSVKLLLRTLAARKIEKPVILTGDFNASEYEAPIQLIVSKPFLFVDALREVETRAVSGTRCFDSEDRGRRIDYIFLSSGSTVHSVAQGEKIDGKCPSDHHFVSADVSF